MQPMPEWLDKLTAKVLPWHGHADDFHKWERELERPPDLECRCKLCDDNHKT